VGSRQLIAAKGRRPDVAIEANAASDQAQMRATADEDVVRDTRSAYERIGGGPAVKELTGTRDANSVPPTRRCTSAAGTTSGWRTT
jgi:hypothetical protein